MVGVEQNEKTMKKKQQEIEIVKDGVQSVIPKKDFSIETLMSQAIEKNTPVETMERLLAVRRELKAEYSKEQFDKDMANFQGNCPIIKKTKAGGKTKGGYVAYYYAPLESIVSQTKEYIKSNNFSYSIQTQTLADKVKVTCTVKHIFGHSESSDVEVPLGTRTDIMSASQVVASALTFAKRYAFCNAFGILTGDDDDDSNSTKVEKEVVHNVIPMSVKTIIANQITRLGHDFKDPAIKTIVHQLTDLELVEGNFQEISNRLEVLINEKNGK